jgi:threonine dehydrogenase-like Zn-dependent dehydrogenase
VPILADNNAEFLERAREAGIYYTVNLGTQDAKKVVKEITGNRMAENVVHVANFGLPVDQSLELSGFNGRMAAVGSHSADFEGNFKLLIDRQLRVIGINNGYDNIPSAINLLANKTINVSRLIKENIPFDAVPEKFKELAADDSYRFQITVDC